MCIALVLWRVSSGGEAGLGMSMGRHRHTGHCQLQIHDAVTLPGSLGSWVLGQQEFEISSPGLCSVGSWRK